MDTPKLLICPPGAYPVTTPDGLEVCAPRLCQAPQILTCEGGTCECRTPVTAMACEVRIQYAQGAPGSPLLVAGPGAWCDRLAPLLRSP